MRPSSTDVVSREHDEPEPRSGSGSRSPYSDVSEHLIKSSTHLLSGLLAANRAMVSSLKGGSRRTNDETVDDSPDELAYTEDDWSFGRTAEARGHLDVGDTVRFTKRLSDADVRSFAHASGDTNRLHLDRDFAERTRFEGRIVHGTLLAGLISSALARLPGLTIYLTQDLEFVAPGRIGERFTAACEVTETLGEARYRLDTRVSNQDDETLLEGEAIVLVDELPDR